MKILCLVDGQVIPPDRWFWNYLPPEAQRDHVDFMSVSIPNLFPKWGKWLTDYPSYLILAMKALWQSRKVNYDAIVAWESKHGFPLAALMWLCRANTAKLVILAFSYKGFATNFVWLSRLAMRAVSHITVLSPGEINHYSQLLHVPLEKISYIPLGWDDLFPASAITGAGSDNFVFASGCSCRDYKTFFDAVKGLGGRFVVNAREFNVRGLQCPPNVVINEFMPPPEFFRLLGEARFVVLPLQNTPHAAGEGHIVQAMSAGKAIVATRTASTASYIEDGRTGLLVNPYDPPMMRSAIEYLLANPDVAQVMGQQARRRYEEKYTSRTMAERSYTVLQKVCCAGQVLSRRRQSVAEAQP